MPALLVKTKRAPKTKATINTSVMQNTRQVEWLTLKMMETLSGEFGEDAMVGCSEAKVSLSSRPTLTLDLPTVCLMILSA